MDRLKHSCIVTVCAACNKILTNDSGPQPEKQSPPVPPPVVSHGLCRDCIHRLYPEIAGSIKKPSR